MNLRDDLGILTPALSQPGEDNGDPVRLVKVVNLTPSQLLSETAAHRWIPFSPALSVLLKNAETTASSAA